MNIHTNNSEINLRKDAEWSLIQDELCLVTDFSPLMGSVVKNKTVISLVTTEPYASINIKCVKVSQEVKVTGFITHRQDFENLWIVFKDRQIDYEKEEVLIYWSTKHYRYKIFKALSIVMLKVLNASNLPKIIVMVCPKGTYKNCPHGFSWPPSEEALVVIYGLMSLSWRIPTVMNENKHLSNSIKE